MGKRASINLTFSSSPAIFGPTQNNRGNSERTFGEASGSIGLNYEFTGDFSYVIGRQASVSLMLGQYNTGLKTDANTIPIGLELIPPVGGLFQDEVDDHELLFRLNVKSVGIIYSKFKSERGALAPIGNRFYIGVKRNFVNASVIDKKTDFYYPPFGSLFGHNRLNIDEQKTFNYLLLGWSNNMIFWDKLIVKTGFRLGLPLDFDNYFYISNETSSAEGYSRNPNQFEYDAELFKRLAWHELFRGELGVGYLLF